jgi:hypothetical protein
VASLQQEFAVKADLKLQAEAMATDITMEVASGRVEIIRLNTKARKLRNQVDGKILLAFAVLLEFSGKLFDVVYACLDSP